ILKYQRSAVWILLRGHELEVLALGKAPGTSHRHHDQGQCREEGVLVVEKVWNHLAPDTQLVELTLGTLADVLVAEQVVPLLIVRQQYVTIDRCEGHGAKEKLALIESSLDRRDMNTHSNLHKIEYSFRLRGPDVLAIRPAPVAFGSSL